MWVCGRVARPLGWFSRALGCIASRDGALGGLGGARPLRRGGGASGNVDLAWDLDLDLDLDLDPDLEICDVTGRGKSSGLRGELGGGGWWQRAIRWRVGGARLFTVVGFTQF